MAAQAVLLDRFALKSSAQAVPLGHMVVIMAAQAAVLSNMALHDAAAAVLYCHLALNKSKIQECSQPSPSKNLYSVMLRAVLFTPLPFATCMDTTFKKTWTEDVCIYI